jgi:hypothetical protein
MTGIVFCFLALDDFEIFARVAHVAGRIFFKIHADTAAECGVKSARWQAGGWRNSALDSRWRRKQSF